MCINLQTGLKLQTSTELYYKAIPLHSRNTDWSPREGDRIKNKPLKKRNQFYKQR
jgi:hypothetical protein